VLPFADTMRLLAGRGIPVAPHVIVPAGADGPDGAIPFAFGLGGIFTEALGKVGGRMAPFGPGQAHVPVHGDHHGPLSADAGEGRPDRRVAPAQLHPAVGQPGGPRRP
jgi:hypothetical protein